MNNDLKNKKCKPCEGESDTLSPEQAETFLEQTPAWELQENKLINREFKFKDFKEAVEFVNKVAKIAEEEGHHPDIKLFNYNQVKITLSTHAIGGLSENDFIVAYQVDRLLE